MRMYGYLKQPCRANQHDFLYKVMLHETKKQGTYAYLYTSPDAVFCSFDYHYADLENALEDWACKIDAQGWTKIEDPFPDCQHDCIAPIRVKGRADGKPQWGQYEQLINGEWVDFIL